VDGNLVLDGIGPLKPKFDSSVSGGSGEELRWLELEFGQTILARVREVPRELPATQRDASSSERSPGHVSAAAPRMPDLFSKKADRSSSRTELAQHVSSSATLNETLKEAIESGFNAELIGRALLAQVQPGQSNERGVALASTILTAYEARVRKRG
jgi:hypothetical protein